MGEYSASSQDFIQDFVRDFRVAPPFTLESIAARLDASQKAQLQEVADGMLRVYRTLVRMQYLEESWIVEGPHDLTSALPTCERLQLDDSIVYLYSILPYVDTESVYGRGGDFFQRSTCIDFRVPRWVEVGRWPLHNEGNRNELMPPWMTPLSAVGNHTTFLVYNAREHILGIRDECGQDCDDNKDEGFEFRDLTEDEWRRLMEDDGNGNDDDVPQQFGDENWEGSDNEYEEDDEHIWDDNMWANLYARQAPNVLRDIVKWFEGLTELPGGGEGSSCAWSPEIIKPLYIKHGWPGTDFDGEAFLVDQARADASQSVGFHLGVEPEQVTLRDQLADLESTLSYSRKESAELGDGDAASRNDRVQREYWGKEVRIYQKAFDACEAEVKMLDESSAR